MHQLHEEIHQILRVSEFGEKFQNPNGRGFNWKMPQMHAHQARNMILVHNQAS
jgi:hypothetical protein